MPNQSFVPELTEADWLGAEEWIRSPECRMAPRERTWAMYRSVFAANGDDVWRRQQLFLIALFREIEPLIVYPEAIELLRVAELAADDRATTEERRSAADAVEELVDSSTSGTETDRWALETVSWVWTKPDDAAESVAALAGELSARGHDGVEMQRLLRAGTERHELKMADLLRDIFGNPFRPVAFDPAWRTEHTAGIAAKMYDEREFTAMPILADALEEAGCDNADILSHCREPGVHVRGCWVVDLVLGKV